MKGGRDVTLMVRVRRGGREGERDEGSGGACCQKTLFIKA